MSWAAQICLWMLPLAASAAGQDPAEGQLRVEGGGFEVGTAIDVEFVVRVPMDLDFRDDLLRQETEARRDLRLRFGEQPFAEGVLDYSWVLVAAEPLVIRRSARAESGSFLVASRKFQLLSLESGERALPQMDFDGQIAPLKVTFAGALGDAEDQARPMVTFQALPDAATSEPESGLWKLLVGTGFILGVGGFVLIWRGRKTSGQVESQGNPRQALTELMGKLGPDSKDPAACQAAHYKLTELLRACIDQGPATSLGTTDTEWLEARLSELNEDLAEEIKALFDECAQVKYGGLASTAWGLEERVSRATSIVERCS